MKKLAFALCLISVITFNTASPASSLMNITLQNVEVKLVASENIKDLLEPKANSVELNRVATTSTLYYTLGRRASHDRVIAQLSERHTFAGPHDLKEWLTYPEKEPGQVVTCVEIEVEQSSSIGRAYIIAGGIGERFIKLLVEAKNTVYFNYIATFYGRS